MTGEFTGDRDRDNVALQRRPPLAIAGRVLERWIESKTGDQATRVFGWIGIGMGTRSSPRRGRWAG